MAHANVNIEEIVNDVLIGINRDTGLSFIHPDENTWLVDLRSTQVHIKNNDPWITSASVLMPDVQGDNKEEFYRGLLEMNGTINHLRIGIEQDMITLSSERPIGEITPMSIVDDLVFHQKGHEQLFERLSEKVHELGLLLPGGNEDKGLIPQF